MKKLLSLALILMVSCSASLLFSGCDSGNGKIVFNKTTPYTITVSSSSVAPENYGNTKYEALATIKFSIVKDGETILAETSLKDARDKGATVTGFNIGSATATGETRKATVSYKGATGSFEYTVVVSA